MAQGQNETFLFVEEASATAPSLDPPWQVLLVDDEPDVHAATKLALKGMQVLGRGLAFTHAYSATQALEQLAAGQEFALAIVDVVMDGDDAGLQLVRQMRERLGKRALRIILRTGQPGYAPELETIQRYDIDDYKTKSELTQVRLITSVTIAVRAYAHVHQLELGRRGLEQILAAATELGRPAGLQKFASGLVTQLCALLQVDEHAVVAAALSPPQREPYVLAAAGRYAAYTDLPLQELPTVRVQTHLARVLTGRKHHLAGGIGLYVEGAHGQALAIYIDLARPLEAIEHDLLRVFCSHIAVAFQNLQLYLDIEGLAFHDALVRLPNRNALVAAIDARRYPRAAVALLDLDGFADINSVLDDTFGDAVLQAVARTLHAAFAPVAMVARLGADVFGLYGPEHELQPERIAQVFAQPLPVRAADALRLSVSTGLARLPDEGRAGVTALRNASAALKQAKRHARGKALYFDAAEAEAARERMHLLNRLRTAFAEERLQLHYQPFIDMRSRRVVGAEGLLRWRTAEGQFIPPDRFIPLAEQSGLMVPMGEWVTRTAMAWRRSLQGRVDDDFRIAINVSHAQFVEPDFVERFLAQLDDAGLPGAQVEIELTESVAVENVGLLSTKLQQLRARGIRVAMDDFGTGYSSLSVLQTLPLDRLKIDRSFISGARAADDGFELARIILALAAHLKLATIAEGIETPAQLAALAAAGCDQAQGYLFSRPLDEASFVRWLSDERPQA